MNKDNASDSEQTPKSTNFSLTEGQERAFESIKKWLLEEETTFKCLTGDAGTGKTTLVDYIVKFALKNKFRTIITAPTNQAVKVLFNKVDHHEFSTLHKLLNIKAKKKDTEEYFEVDHKLEPKVPHYDFIVVDECSMVGIKLLEELERAVGLNDIKVLFVGDIAQLKPVEEEVSITFGYDPVELTEIVRHDDVIAHASKKLRVSKQTVKFSSIVNPPTIEWVKMSEIKKLFRGFDNNPHKYRMICYTNANVLKWNAVLRKENLGREPHAPFEVGEIVMSRSACTDIMDHIFMHNSEEAIVEKVTKKDDAYVLDVRKFSNNKVVTVRVIREEYIDIYQKKLQNLAISKSWTEFWLLKKKYHDIRHCFAMTAHNMQGHTIENSIIDTKDILKNRDIEERNQLIYVAMTRAQKRILFY